MHMRQHSAVHSRQALLSAVYCNAGDAALRPVSMLPFLCTTCWPFLVTLHVLCLNPCSKHCSQMCIAMLQFELETPKAFRKLLRQMPLVRSGLSRVSGPEYGKFPPIRKATGATDRRANWRIGHQSDLAPPKCQQLSATATSVAAEAKEPAVSICWSQYCGLAQACLVAFAAVQSADPVTGVYAH
ncbi:TPA: hypothetical protein ACH3X1_001945 [Trebouxia sp. C0004]